jgi:hypothetical protein
VIGSFSHPEPVVSGVDLQGATWTRERVGSTVHTTVVENRGIRSRMRAEPPPLRPFVDVLRLSSGPGWNQ